MHFTVKKLPTAFLVFSLALTSGCLTISRKTRIPTDQQLLPAESQSRTQLLEHLENLSNSISSLTAEVSLDVSSGRSKSDVLTGYRETQGILIVDRPNQVRMRVLAPVVATTVVDMVSDGSQYRVWNSVSNKFFIGDAKAPPTSKNTLLNLRPQHILDALFVDVRPYEANPRVTRFIEEVTSGRIR